MSQFDQVCVVKRANVYFGGQCISHTVLFADGSKKTLGVIFPGRLTFSTGLPEVMDINAGRCRVLLPGEQAWQTVEAGGSFSVPGNSQFEIEALELLDYVCHFVPQG